jgi:hypothetical protein
VIDENRWPAALQDVLQIVSYISHFYFPLRIVLFNNNLANVAAHLYSTIKIAHDTYAGHYDLLAELISENTIISSTTLDGRGQRSFPLMSINMQMRLMHYLDYIVSTLIEEKSMKKRLAANKTFVENVQSMNMAFKFNQLARTEDY